MRPGIRNLVLPLALLTMLVGLMLLGTAFLVTQADRRCSLRELTCQTSD